MRTLKYHLPQRQVEIAQETLDIYAPLAHRLGIDWIKSELEDLAFQYIHPEIYEEIQQKIAKREKERTRYIEEVKRTLAKKLYENHIECDVAGRLKQIYSIYRKMREQNLELDESTTSPHFVSSSVPSKNATTFWESSILSGNPSPGNSKTTSAFPRRTCTNRFTQP
jgi:hypothetical protein